MKPFNVLVTAGSRRVPLVQSFRAALRSLGLPGVVIVTDVNPLSPAVHVADRAYRVPMSSDRDYLDESRAICATERVRLVTGADFPQMLIRLALGRRVEPQIGAFRDQLWMTSFETSFFFESPFLVRPGFDARLPVGGVA